MDKTPTGSALWAFKPDNVENWAYANNVFTPEECDKIIQIGLNKIIKPALIGGNGNGVVDTTIRDSNITWLGSQDDMGWAYDKLAGVVQEVNSKFFNFDLFGFTENMQFTEYKPPGGKYDFHIDKILYGTVRKLSMVVQLTDPAQYTGGELQIWTGGRDELNMEKTRGSVFFFPSYVMHRVKPVTAGTRYSLVAWVGGVPFK